VGKLFKRNISCSQGFNIRIELRVLALKLLASKLVAMSQNMTLVETVAEKVRLKVRLKIRSS
jgi:hypothetical protein